MADNTQYCLVWTAESVLYQPISEDKKITREDGDSYAVIDIAKKTVVFNDLELQYDPSLDPSDDSFPDKIIDFLESKRPSSEMESRVTRVEASVRDLHDHFQDHLDTIAGIEKRFEALLASHAELQKKHDDLLADHAKLKAVTIDTFERTKSLLNRK